MVQAKVSDLNVPSVIIGARVSVTIEGVTYEGVIVGGRWLRNNAADVTRQALGQKTSITMEAHIQLADAPR